MKTATAERLRRELDLNEQEFPLPQFRPPAHPSMIPSREECLRRMLRLCFNALEDIPDHTLASLLALEPFAESGVFADA